MTDEQIRGHSITISLKDGDVIFFDDARIDGELLGEALGAVNPSVTFAFIPVRSLAGKSVSDALCHVTKEAAK